MLEAVKEYLRIDGDQDDKLLGRLISAAKEHLAGAGVKERVTSQYELAVVMLVTHWYENREQNQFGKISSAIEHGLQTLILQMKVGGSADQSSEVPAQGNTTEA